MPEATQNYYIIELKLCGLAINIPSFAHLLEKVNFDAIVGYLALTNIIRSKVVPAKSSIKR